MQKTGNNYAMLNEKRSELSQKEGKRHTAQVASALQAHTASLSYLKALAELERYVSQPVSQPVLETNKRSEIWEMLHSFAKI